MDGSEGALLSHRSIEEQKLEPYQAEIIDEQTVTLEQGIQSCLEIVESQSRDITIPEEEIHEQTNKVNFSTIQVKKAEEQLSMEDGPSFVSPNGSFDHSNVVRGQVRESALNEVKVQDPRDSKRSNADEQLINELRTAN